mgnify:CR=1 FL=1
MSLSVDLPLSSGGSTVKVAWWHSVDGSAPARVSSSPETKRRAQARTEHARQRAAEVDLVPFLRKSGVPGQRSRG